MAGGCGSKSTFQSPAGGQGYLTLLMCFCLLYRKPEASIAVLHMHRKHTWEEAMKENSLSVLISRTCCRALHVMPLLFFYFLFLANHANSQDT